MVDQAVSDAVLNAVKGQFKKGDSFRMRHKPCTPPEKDPAMVVTRRTGGYTWHCHRCHTSGWVGDASRSPSQVVDLHKSIDSQVVTEFQNKLIDLPFDFQPFVVDARSSNSTGKSVPFNALNHVLKYGITHESLLQYNIGWSNTWGRIIFPLYEFDNGRGARKLVGWVGRDPSWSTKSEHPKWLTRSNRDKRRYYMCPGIGKSVVLVEDAISATKVWQATGYTTIALLTTTVSNDLVAKLRDKTVYLWLDGDQLAHSVQTVCRLRELGLTAKRVHTTQDPKCYSEVAIRVNLKAGDHELSEVTRAAMGLPVDPSVWEGTAGRYLTDPYCDREEKPDYAG